MSGRGRPEKGTEQSKASKVDGRALRLARFFDGTLSVSKILSVLVRPCGGIRGGCPRVDHEFGFRGVEGFHFGGLLR